MRFPGDILRRHKWPLFLALFMVVVFIPAGANQQAYENAVKTMPQIPWENISQSAFIIFFWNLMVALASFFVLLFLFVFLLSFRIFIIVDGPALGMSIGMVLWLISQNGSYITAFSHGILELYSLFLAVVGGYLLVVKLCEAVWGFFKFVPHYVDWNEVLTDYLWLFVFCVIGLFLSAWMEASLGYAIIKLGSLAWIIASVNTLLSLMIVGIFTSRRFRKLLMRKIRHGTMDLI